MAAKAAGPKYRKVESLSCLKTISGSKLQISAELWLRPLTELANHLLVEEVIYREDLEKIFGERPFKKEEVELPKKKKKNNSKSKSAKVKKDEETAATTDQAEREDSKKDEKHLENGSVEPDKSESTVARETKQEE